ncbi:MAG: acylphosphatase [Leptospiraceae bacterium]|nr:acylphosphatase [Leptospiraceae bacterium]
MSEHWSITVCGRVQGVYFRQSTLQKARSLALTGYVRNLPNGDVYIEAEGEALQLQELLTWCHAGPPMARVSAVQSQVGTIKNFTDFSVR